ncbi:ABC-type branched-chain amino acid transport system, periplasmic component [Desulfosporosinus orientis DSM 765]|uniref:ABC-type branched-chain amino acid transport system, periplasmic component n=1 Tax=Desulfosporosinus orientis (strain ATCC 19365 / DSM 765 / NCIMB 8382 / VKM B-1628 / Singapore I) TaxID=768706 RepID=G7WE38_DESOD|nr:ABC transporter substrate-binding protein [Desulfosporosinus orientis]AET69436.1 ABC-type branched-chain amino acid transport system, periplasmic component [Desulfosporosinus orientis DSM 765]
MIRKKSKALVAMSLVMSALLMVSGCGASKTSENASNAADSKEPIKIGFLGAKTGDVAIYGLNTLKGLNMAVEELNKEGVLGRQVELVEEDNAGQKDQAINITNKLISQDKVVAIIGDPTTGITRVAGQIANSKKTVIMSAGSTGTNVVEIGPYVFRDTLLDTIAAPATMKYIIQDKGWKNVALITSKNNDYSVSLSKIFSDAIKANGGNIVIEEYIQDKDTDFSGQVTKIKAANPDVIVFSGYYTEGALIMKKAREVGIQAVMVGGDGLQGDDLMKIGGAAVEGSISYAGFSPEQPTPNTEKFINAFKAKYNNELPDLFAAQGYDALMLIAKAIKDANSADPEVFKDTLAKTKNYDGVSGSITFQESREPIKSPVYLLEVKDGKFSLLKKVPIEVK